MRRFDETWMSAYLDDELDPESRRRVDEALRADPRLDRMLHDLARVRGLVAGLHRPTEAPDVSDAVLGRIAPPTVRRRALPPLAAAVSLAAAALLVLSFLANRPHHVPAARDGRPAAGDLAVTDPPVGPAEAPDLAADAPLPDAVAVALAPSEAPEPAPTPPPTTTVADAGPTPEQADRLRFALDLVDYPASRQFQIAPAPGTSAAELRAELEVLLRDVIRLDARYALIHTDPSGGADLFAFVASPAEWDTLLDLIEEALGPRSVRVEPAGRPRGAPVLADVGALQLRTAPWVAPLRRDPSDAINASRHHPHEAMTTLEDPRLVPSLPGGLPALPGVPLDPSSRPAAPPGPVGPLPGVAPSDVVLLWLRPSGRGEGQGGPEVVPGP